MLFPRSLSLFVGLSAVLGSTACSAPAASDGTGGTNAGTGGATSATGGATSATGGAAGVSETPTDTSQAAIEAFLAAGSYKTWKGDAAPRESPEGLGGMHQGLIRVYFNQVALQSIAANLDIQNPTHTQGMVVVKEVYSSAGALIATALRYQSGPGQREIAWYCSGDTKGCAGPTENPYYAEPNAGLGVCSNCHSSNVFAPVPE